MEIIRATNAQFQTVRDIVKTTIETVYPNYYPSGAVDFFLSYHSDEAIRETIAKGSGVPVAGRRPLRGHGEHSRV